MTQRDGEQDRDSTTQWRTKSAELSHWFDAMLYRVSPSLSDRLSIHRQVMASVVPRGVVGERTINNLPTEYLGHEGIDLHEDEQIALLRTWSKYHDVHEAIRSDPAVNTLGTSTCLENDWYETPDAEIYASMICDYRPTDIIEIGVGYSTLVARHAIDWANLDTRVTAIDPEPRRSVATAADAVLLSRVEDIDLRAAPFSDLSERVLLFVDSSHVVRAGGDIPLLFNQLIPSLPSGSLVHVDDVYIPWDYPTSYRKRLYTEQYVLQALLAHSDRFRTTFASYFMGRTQTDLMREIISPNVDVGGFHVGSSYWFAVT